MTLRQESAREFLVSVKPAFHQGDEHSDEKTIESERVAELKEVYSAVVRGDYAALEQSFHDEIELEISGPDEVPFRGCWKDRQEVIAAIERHFSQVEEQQPVVESITAQGNSIVVIGKERGRYCASGQAYCLHLVQEFRFEGDKLRRFREIVSNADGA